MTTYEQVKQKIIAKVPEIMELKFGCEVLWSYEHQIGGVRSRGGVCRFRRVKKGKVTYVHYYQGVPSGEDTSYACVVFERAITVRKIPVFDLKILGRTITIADVLRAINETNKMKSNLCYFEDMCDLIRPVYEDGKLIREAYWSLEHDSLAWHAENRPEVIEFLNKIL